MLPPTSILVAVDLSDPSRTALRLAARLAGRTGARLHVLYVENPLLVMAATNRGVNLTAEAREALARFIDTVPETAACDPCRDVVVGGPGHAIVTIAEREGADLIVIGSHGLSGTERKIVGSVTQQVLSQATRSVLVVPAAWMMPEAPDDLGLGPIVVGVDRSAAAVTAARAAAAFAATLKTTVTAVHVVGSVSAPACWATYANQALLEQLELAGRDVTQLLALTVPAIAGVDIDTGDVAERLVAASTPGDSRRPLLMLGHQASDRSHAVAGAIAQRVAMLAQCPMLVFVEQTI